MKYSWADGIIWQSAEKFLRLAVGIFIGALLARYFGPAGYGVIGLAASLLMIASVLATVGLPSIVAQDIANQTVQSHEALGTSMLVYAMAACIVLSITVAGIFMIYSPSNGEFLFYAITSASIVFSPANVFRSFFEGVGTMRWVAIADGVAFLSSAAIKIATVVFNGDILWIAAAIFAECAIAGMMLAWFYSKTRPEVAALSVKRCYFLSVLKRGWPMLVSGFAVMIYMRIDQFMIAALANQEEVGLYVAPLRIVEAFYVIPAIAASSLFTYILKRSANSGTGIDTDFGKLLGSLCVVGYLITLIVTWASPYITMLLWGDRFSGSSEILRIQILSLTFVILGTVSSRWYIHNNLQTLAMIFISMGAIVNVVLNLLLIPRYGGTGAAMATVASFAVATLFCDLIIPQSRRMAFIKLQALLSPASFWRSRSA